MEVPGRSLPRRLIPGLALAAALAAALAIVLGQPLRAPWWTYADADASYAASSLNLLLGAQVRYLDHPGLPLEELGAVAYGVQYLLETGGAESRKTFVDELMLDLDRARIVFRSLAVALYLAGAVLAVLLVGRLLGWGWGVAGGLLWIAAPGLAAMSIQFRPDVPLAMLCLVAAFFLARAVQTRALGAFVGAAFTIGLATMVKLHAAGLLPALALAALWRPPVSPPVWPRPQRKHLLLLTAPFALAVAVNADRIPFEVTTEEIAAAAVPLTAAAVLLALHRFLGLVAAAFLAGLWLPVLLDLQDGLRSLVNVGKGLTGAGVNDPVEPFAASLDPLLEFPLRQALVVFLLAGAAAVVGVLRREPLPVVLFTGAAILAVMAEARLAVTHYFAPAFVVAVPAALWLLRRRGGAGAVAAAVLVAYAVVPNLDNRRSVANTEQAFERAAAPALRLVESRLEPGEVGLTDSYWPHPDVRYFEVVELYVDYTPDYPYRLLPASAIALERSGKEARYYASFGVGERVSGELELAGQRFKARRISDDVVELRPIP